MRQVLDKWQRPIAVTEGARRKEIERREAGGRTRTEGGRLTKSEELRQMTNHAGNGRRMDDEEGEGRQQGHACLPQASHLK